MGPRKDNVRQPATVRKPQVRHRGCHTYFGIALTLEGEGRQREKEEAEVSKEEEGEEGGVVECLNNLTIETAGTEEEAAEGLKAALCMAQE